MLFQRLHLELTTNRLTFIRHQSPTKPVIPDSCSLLASVQWADNTFRLNSINPLRGWVYRGPGLAPSDLPPPILECRSATGYMSAYAGEFKSRRPDDFKGIKTPSGGWG